MVKQANDQAEQPDDVTARRAAREALEEPIAGDREQQEPDARATAAAREALELTCARCAETTSRALAALLHDDNVALPPEECRALGAAWAPVVAELRGVAPSPLTTALLATAMIAGPRVVPAVAGAIARRRRAKLDPPHAKADDPSGRDDPSRRAGERKEHVAAPSSRVFEQDVSSRLGS